MKLPRREVLALHAFVVGLIGCSDAPTANRLPPRVSGEVRDARELLAPEVLPYGVPIPVDTSLNAFPEPYQPEKHGPALPNSSPGANLVGQLADDLPPRPQSGAARFSGPPPLVSESQSYSLGIFPSPATQFYGINLTHDAELSVQLPAVSGSPGTCIRPPCCPLEEPASKRQRCM